MPALCISPEPVQADLKDLTVLIFLHAMASGKFLDTEKINI